MRQRDRHTGQVLVQELTHAQLVDRVHDRPEEADRDRLHARLAHAPESLQEALLVERPQYPAFRADPLGHLEGERARNVGLGVGMAEVEDLGPPALAEQEDVGVTLRRQEGGAGRVAGEHRVEPAGRAVDQDRAGAEQLSARLAALVGGHVEHVEDALHGVRRDGRALVDPEPTVAVLDHQVGEGPACVDRESHRLTPRITALSIRTPARIVNTNEYRAPSLPSRSPADQLVA
jgi:hypothetical protein